MIVLIFSVKSYVPKLDVCMNFCYLFQSEIAKRSLEDEIAKLRNNLSEMEKSYVMKCEEAASAIETKEKDITTLMNDIAILRNEVNQKV